MNENLELYFKFPEKIVSAEIINKHLIKVAEKTKHYGYKKYYVIDYKGKVLSIKYDDISVLNENFLSTLKTTNFFGLTYYKNGLISNKGKLIFEPIFDDVNDIGGKYVKINCDNDLEGILDENGKTILKCKYKLYPYSKEKYSLVEIEKKNKCIGFFSNKTGQVINFKHNYDFVENFNKYGYARVRLNEKYGVIDTLGNEILKPKYYLLHFSANNEFIKASKSKKSKYSSGDETNKLAAFNLSGVKILKSEYYNVEGFDDFYLVSQRQNGTFQKYGLISKTLEHKTKCIYSGFVNTNSKGLAKVLFKCGEKRYFVLYRYERHYQYGLMNSNLEILLPCKYTSISNFNQFGIAIIEEMQIDEIYTIIETNIKIKGIINQDGKVLISPKFLDIKPFSKKGVAVIKDKNHKFGLINSDGKIISSGKYDEIYSYDNNSFAKVETSDFIKINGDYQKQNIKYGIININGLEIFPVIFDSILSTENGYELAYSNLIFKFNTKGVCILNCVEYRDLTSDYYINQK
jgi:hypothetical protein